MIVYHMDCGTSLVEMYQYFKGMFHLRLKCRRITFFTLYLLYFPRQWCFIFPVCHYWIFFNPRSECRSSMEPRLDPNLRDLLEDLECPVCREYMTPPISICVSGHSICKTCRRKLKKCRMCTKTFTKSRNLALEKIIGKMKYPCKYEDLGCTGLFSLECLASHQADCPRQAHRCPFAVLDAQTCTWEGTADAVVGHMKANHSDICSMLNRAGKFRTRLWDIVKGPLWCRAVYKQDDVFLWYTKLVESHVYSCLLYMGVKEEAAAFKYKMTINNVGKTGSFMASHRTCPYPNNVDKIFQNCDCVIFHHEFVKKCIDAEKCLLVEIEVFRHVQQS